VRRFGRRPAGAGIALAGLVLTVTVAAAGCGQALPLGPGPTPAPAPRHLAAAIVMEPGLGQPEPRSGGCPVGQVVLTGPGTTNTTTYGDYTSTTTGLCYRLLGKPVTFTSAGVTWYLQTAGNEPVKHSAQYLVAIYLPAAEAAALTALTTKLAGPKDQIAIIIAGQTWDAPTTEAPLAGGQFVIPVRSKSQALQLQRILLPPA
jgi:hypothetical protein